MANQQIFVIIVVIMLIIFCSIKTNVDENGDIVVAKIFQREKGCIETLLKFISVSTIANKRYLMLKII